MPATAGRVRMPANNRVHSSAALQTHGIWQSAIGYDPYAPTTKEGSESKSTNKDEGSDNAYASFQGLLALARITGSNADDSRGACKKCGRIGHLTFQCRNFLSVKGYHDDDAAAATVVKKNESEAEEELDEEEESESSDSDYDSEIEKIIAERNGKKSKKRSRNKSHRRKKDSSDEESRRHRHKHSKKSKSRSRKHEYSDSESEGYEERRSRRHRKDRRVAEEFSRGGEEDARRSRKKWSEKMRCLR